MIEPLRANQYATILKLKSSINSLDKLKEIPSEYRKMINVKKSMQDKVNSKDSEFFLTYSWENRDIERLRVGDKNSVNYMIWNARIEHQKMNMYDITGTKILPKKDRTGEYYVPTIFYENNDEVYLCIVTKKDNALRAVRELIDNKNIDISSNYLATNQNMVEWLFWRYMSKQSSLEDGNISIDNLWSFEGNIIEGDSSDFLKGRSSQISNLDVTKAVISLGDPLTASRLSMTWAESKLDFSYSTEGIVSVDPKRTILDKNIRGGAVGLVAGTYEKLVFIISIVIPKIIDIFNNDSQNFNKKFEKFKQKQAQDLIDKLKSLNNLEDE